MPVFPYVDIGGGLPGSLITDDYQYQFGDVLIGAGTPYVVEKISGLLGQATTRSGNVDKGNAHGSLPGLLLFSERTIAFDFLASSQFNGIDVESLMDQLSNSFQPPNIRNSKVMDGFAYKRPGRDIRQFFARATKLDIDSTGDVARGLVAGSIEIVANDPLSYSINLNEEVINLAIGATSGSTTINMSGNCRNGTPPILYIGGPCTNPIVQNTADNGRQLKLQVVLTSGQIARVNMETFDVDIQTGGGVNPWVESFSIVRDDSQFWQVMPGNNLITYNRTGSTALSTLKIDWLDAWVRG